MVIVCSNQHFVEYASFPPAQRNFSGLSFGVAGPHEWNGLTMAHCDLFAYLYHIKQGVGRRNRT